MIDQNVLDTVGPVLILGLLVGGFVIRWILRSPVGEALAERIRRSGAGTTDVAKQLEQMRSDLLSEMQLLRTELSDLSERMDFAERVLAKSRESQRIAPGS